MRIMTLGDKLLIVLIFIISIYFIFNIMGTTIDPSDKDIVIRIDGVEEAKIPLNTGKESKTYDFRFGENIGRLETIEGRVRMLPMDKEVCPKQICSDTGWIESSYQMIVCLPNKIMVTIETIMKQDIDIMVMK